MDGTKRGEHAWQESCLLSESSVSISTGSRGEWFGFWNIAEFEPRGRDMAVPCIDVI